MVGAGIFALLGEAATIAGSAVWLSFLLAGLITMLLAYNVVKLGIRYPSEGSLIEYLRQGDAQIAGMRQPVMPRAASTTSRRTSSASAVITVHTSLGIFVARRWETRRLLPAEALESAPI